MKELFLNESGTDYNMLKSLLADIDNSTELLDINTATMAIFSPIRVSKQGNETFVFYRTSGKIGENSAKGTLTVPHYAELIEKHGDSIVNVGKGYISASLKCMASIYTRLGVIGDALQMYGLNYTDDENKKEIYISKRDDFIKVLMENGIEGKLLYRKNDTGDARALHMFSSKGEHILQSTIIELIDYISSQMGADPHVRYTVQDDLTCVWVEYPDKADDFSDDKGSTQQITPGVYIETSDTGECALTLRGTETVKGTTIYSSVIRRVHKGTFDINDFMQRFDKTIFPEYLKYPQRMIDLAMVDVSDADIYIDALFEQSSLGAVLGRQKKEIKSLVISSLNGNITALDIILAFMDLNKNVKVVTKEKETKLAEALSDALFTDVVLKQFVIS